MRLTAALLLLLVQGTVRTAPEPAHFRFERKIQVPAGASGRVCAALDGTVYEHSPGLTDIRLFAGTQELPYALMTSQTEVRSDAARILNLGVRNGHIVYDLAMPARPYSTVDLRLGDKNFLATATVTGKQTVEEPGTALGVFTLFDLTGQHLGRNTSVALTESTFPFLHVDLEVKPAPGFPGIDVGTAMVNTAEVPPSREAQTLYTTVAATNNILQMASQSVAVFDLPAHVPVERVRFEIAPPESRNFSRTVHLTARARTQKDQPPSMDEDIYGNISRVRVTEAGKEIRQESLAVLATLGSNVQSGARVQVAVENGDDQPVPIRAVLLEMRERKLCFDASTQPVTMFYGDPSLVPPVYDYARLFEPGDPSVAALLEPEGLNPAYAAPVEHRALTERHPELIWLALLTAVAALGFVAFRSAKRI